MGATCKHCRDGFFDPNSGGHYFGQDIECVNGVLIDIDEYHEGWPRDVIKPVAPCHPMFARQQAGDESWRNDSLERLEASAPLATQPSDQPDTAQGGE